MAETALNAGDRSVVFIHYAKNAKAQAFKNKLRDWEERFPQFKAYIVYNEASADLDAQPDAVGMPSVEQLQQWMPEDRNVEAYFLGPKPFMAFMKRTLDELGVPEDQAHYEFFGPAEELV
jgi:nitric oxide dioxygenase